MRYIILFWVLPMGFFWGWYFLSLNDASPQFFFFSRQMHDLVFEVYGDILGMEPALLPPLVVRACVVDTILIFAIFAFRRRRPISLWLGEVRLRYLRGESVSSRSSTP
jgi:hypothetical protein